MPNDEKIRVVISSDQPKNRYEENQGLFSKHFGEKRAALNEVLALPEVVKLTSKFNLNSSETLNPTEEDSAKLIRVEISNIFTTLVQARTGLIDQEDAEYDLELSDIEITELFIQANIDQKYGQYSDYDDADLTHEHRGLVKAATHDIANFVRREIPAPAVKIS